jgi:hypothetical protein
MDHFNATVQDGNLVSTRRGLQVSKTKHHGTRFVNAFAAPSAAGKAKKPAAGDKMNDFVQVDSSKALERRFKFVTKSRESKKHGSTSPFRVTMINEDGTEAVQKRPKKKAAKRREESVATDSTWPSSISSYQSSNSSCSSSISSFSSSSSDGTRPKLSVDARRAMAEENINSWTAKLWKTHKWGFDLPELNQRQVHTYFAIVPSKMYPLEQLLKYNPCRQPSFFERGHMNLITMHYIIMTSNLIESYARGELVSEEFSFYVSKVCALVNGQLQDSRGRLDHNTMESIAAMAILGVSQSLNPIILEPLYPPLLCIYHLTK